MEGFPYCPLLAMTGSNTPLGCSLPSLQLSNAACNVAGCSKPLPSGALCPKATAQSKPLHTGTLTSAEFSGQEASTTPTVRDARN